VAPIVINKLIETFETQLVAGAQKLESSIGGLRSQMGMYRLPVSAAPIEKRANAGEIRDEKGGKAQPKVLYGRRSCFNKERLSDTSEIRLVKAGLHNEPSPLQASAQLLFDNFCC
jgi:hypothetical protein